jgi:hypothetical protein
MFARPRHFSLTTLALVTLLGCDAENSTPPAPLVPRTVDQDASLEALALSQTRVHVKTAGNPAGRVLIVLHGGPVAGDLAPPTTT